MPEPSALESLGLAKSHLKRVQAAWSEPDWLDLATYGFYCLEAAVMAAGSHAGLKIERSHPGKAKGAKMLSQTHHLPDVSGLMRDLNDARKSKAYGDIEFPELDSEDTASNIEAYVKAVQIFLRT